MFCIHRQSEFSRLDNPFRLGSSGESVGSPDTCVMLPPNEKAMHTIGTYQEREHTQPNEPFCPP